MTRTRRIGLGLAAATAVLALLGACAASGASDVAPKVGPALVRTVPEVRSAESAMTVSGTSRTLDVSLAIDGEEVDAALLRRVLVAIMAELGDGADRFAWIQLGVYSGSFDGELLPLRSAAVELGFEDRNWTVDADFDEQLADVRSVLASSASPS